MQRILVYEYLSGGGEAGSPAEAETLLPVGVAMRNAILSDLARLPGVAVSCAVCDRPGAHLPAGLPGEAAPVALAARPGEPPAAFVRRMAERHDAVWVVAPETDGLLAQLHEAAGPARWIGCDAQAIRLASGKRATLEALAAAGIDTPLALADKHAGAWVVKPDDGAGTVDTRVHARRAEALADAQARARAGRCATVEPFIEGEALSVSMLVAPGAGGSAFAPKAAVEPLAFNRQRIVRAADGTLADHGVQVAALDARGDTRVPRLAALAREVARALLGLRGFVGLDVVWHAWRGPVAIEVNPRVTSAYVGLSAALGRNLAREILALHGVRHA